jgi:hypothetical protein
MVKALTWFRAKEPKKDIPKHINFFKPFILPKPKGKLGEKIANLAKIITYKS